MFRDVAHQMDTMECYWRQSMDDGSSMHIIESHLVFQRRIFKEAGLKSGIVPASIHHTYQVMYRSQEQIVREDWIEGLPGRE